MSGLRDYLAQWRIFIVIVAPLEVTLCVLIGAWQGAVNGWDNVRLAWKGSGR